MLHRVPTPDGSLDILDTEDAGDEVVSPQPDASLGRGSPVPVAATSTSSTGSSSGTAGTATLASETITRTGSGLVFNNTYGAGVTTNFRNEIVAAENYLQSQFTNSCTINCSFDLQSLNPAYSGENSFNPIVVSYSTFVNALASHAISPAQKAAVASLQHLSDPSQGMGFMVPVGEARILGLASGPSGGTIDDTVVLNSYYWNANALQNNPTDAEAVIEHEVSEGGMGRIGSLGIADSYWAPMDLFRFTASGQRDFTGGQDGQATYFSVNGTSVSTGLQYHDSVNTSGQFDGEDFADWDQVGQDANAHDPFGPGGPGAGDPGTLSATDLQIMNVLGWAQPSTDGIAVSPTKADALQGGAALTLLTATPVISDSKSTTIANATVKVANGSGSAVSGDKLFVAGVQSGIVSGVTVSWNATTSTLTLSGSASIATYQSLLSQITYQDTGADGSSGSHPVRTVMWSVNDGTQTLTATSQVTVDRAPTVNNETGFAVAGATLSVAAANGALAGDSDLDGDALAVTAVNGAAVAAGGTSVTGSFGRLTINPNGSYSYAANAGVPAGSQDSFNVTVGDGNGGTASATLKVTIDNALVTAPLAILTPTGKATPSSWTLAGSGGNGSLTFGLASAAGHGTAVVNANGTFTYTPVAGYSGSDSFQYRVTDGLGETSVNTVSVGVGSGYSVTQSLQFTAAQSQYLSQTPSVAGNQETWTWSGWVNTSSTPTLMALFGAANGSNWADIRFDNDKLEVADYSNASQTYLSRLLTNQTFNANTWYQVTVEYDTTQAVAANRIELFVNGQQITSFQIQQDPSQNFASAFGSAGTRYLGQDGESPVVTSYLNGNLADVQFVDGQALGPSSFGALVNGMWQPIAYTGSYGTGSYHLTFASGSGTDSSGNGNNFTLVNGPSVSSATPGGSGAQVALTLDNGLPFNGGSGDAISGATVRLTGGFANDADLVTANTSGTSIAASWNATSETLTLSGTDTAAHYQSVLDDLLFTSGATDPSNGGANPTRTATWQVTDATNNQLSDAQSETIDISPAYAPTGIAVAGVATTAEAVQGGPAVNLLSGAPVITDPSTTLRSATIQVTNGGTAVSGDKLFVAGVQSGIVSGVTVSWNATTSTLTLSGSASIATYQSLLSQITYQDTGADGSSGSHPVRTVMWSVNDGTQTLTATSQVTVDRAPTVNNETGFAVAGATLSVAAANGALAGDSDLDGDALAVTAVNGAAVAAGGTSVTGSFGRLTINPNGSYSYAANAGVPAGSQDSFNVTVGDGNGGTASATLKVTIDNALVTAPLAILTPTGKATPSSWTLAGSGGNGSLTFGLASAAGHGTAVVNANGTFTYTPVAGYSGADSFQYRVTDGLGETSLNTVSVGVGSGYSITQSMQFAASQSQYLSQTPSVAGNQETWTWSGWVNVSSTPTLMALFGAANGSNWSDIRFDNGKLEIADYSNASDTYLSRLLTNQTFNPNTWYQVTVVYDTTQAVAANRIELFVNGQQITSYQIQIDPSQNFASAFGSAGQRYLGLDGETPIVNSYLNGNLADVQFVDGQALGPSSFGALVNGMWQPIAYTGSYGTGSYHLTFASGSGTDSSGNGNNFTLVNGPSVSSATPGGSGAQVALTLDNGLPFNGGSGDAISGATVRLTGGFANDADLVTANTSGTSIAASWNATSETLTLSGTDTAAHYQSVLDDLLFTSGATDPSNGGANPTRTATWQVTDATNNQPSAAQSETIDISPAYAPTGIAVAGVATTAEAVQGGPAINLVSGAPVITDPSTTLTSATIKVTNGSGTAVAGDRKSTR